MGTARGVMKAFNSVLISYYSNKLTITSTRWRLAWLARTSCEERILSKAHKSLQNLECQVFRGSQVFLVCQVGLVGQEYSRQTRRSHHRRHFVDRLRTFDELCDCVRHR